MSFKRWLWTLLTGSKYKACILDGYGLLKSGRKSRALESFRMAMEERPLEPDAYQGMSETYRAMDLLLESRREVSIADALEIIKQKPDDARARLDLAKGFFDKSRYSWAQYHLDQIPKLDTQDYEIVNLAARIYNANRNYSKAAQFLEQYVHDHPLAAEPYESLAKCLRAARSIEGAAKAAAKATALKDVAQDPSDAKAVEHAMRLLASANQNDAARALVENSLESNPDSASLHGLMGEFLINLEHDRQGALKHLLKAVKINPIDLKAHRTLAKVYMLDGQEEQAKQHLKLVETLEKARAEGDPMAMEMAKIRLLFDSNRPDLALERCEVMIEANSQDWRGLYLKGLILRKQGNTKEAMVHLKQARSLDVNAPEPHLELAWLFSDMGDVLEAISEARQAVALAQHEPTFRLELAKILRVHGYLNQAMEEEDVADSIAREQSKSEAKKKR